MATKGTLDLAVLEVDHKGERKMVGKLVKARTEILERVVFLHVHTTSQNHLLTDCPSPCDATVLAWLRERGVGLVFAYEQDTETMRVATVAALLASGTDLSDGRLRHYLPRAEWFATIPRVREIRGDKGHRAYVAASGRTIIETPYLRRTILVNGKGAA
jgi:hypothetical protein